MKLIHLLYLGVLVLLASCAEEDTFPRTYTDPRDGKSYHLLEIAGLTWMREDLQYKDSVYSFQQALFACPPGWSLPTQEDWASLGEFFGGYETYNAEVGSPMSAYTALTSTGFNGFSATKDFYWSSTPAWVDGSIVRSYSFGLDSVSKRAVLKGTSNADKIYCRCVKREVAVKSENFAQLTIEGQQIKFDSYATFFPQKVSDGMLSAYLYKELEDQQLTNRVMIAIQLPGQYVTGEDHAKVVTSAVDHQVITPGEYKVNSILRGTDQLSLKVTFYDGKTVRGTFGSDSTLTSASAHGEFQLIIADRNGS